MREHVRRLTDLPNVGPACARDLERLGIHAPAQLAGQDARAMYERLCALTGVRQDPCVLDVFVSITRFMAGEPARPWWHYSAQRKQAQLRLP